MFNYTKLDPDLCDFVQIAPLNELGNGERLFVEIDNLPIVVFNIGGEFFAIADVCSHDDGPLGEGDLEDEMVICSRHGATFDVRTGKVLSLPAIVDIPAYPTRVENGFIEIGLPKES